ncbi:unnamed protein product [Fraxinus pennsylvanica]|uniref:Uncharacterized protein n=1 Tax=Fraxinus pennsylvanica TaxID=56036 RepID=A0AAD2AKT0_9LAMI|nr:unnamed protein product [Fraxinus pennsylvanica]
MLKQQWMKVMQIDEVLQGQVMRKIGIIREKKKLSQKQSAFLEESFEEHHILNPVSHIMQIHVCGLELLDGSLVGPRAGIECALPDHVTALWRFAMAGIPCISAPKNTLRSRNTLTSGFKQIKSRMKVKEMRRGKKTKWRGKEV